MSKTFTAKLVTNQRGPILTRKVATREDAFAEAHRLLDHAEDHDVLHGETISIQIAEDADWRPS